MDTQLFLAPASKSSDKNNAFDHFQTTVLEGLSTPIHDPDTDRSDTEESRVWGLTSNTEQSWEQIQVGDWILFYTDVDTYGYAAQVVGKEHNPLLGDRIRSNVLDLHKGEERDWAYLIYLGEPVEVDATGEYIADLFDYGNEFPVRFMRVTEERMDDLKTEYGSVDEFVESLRTAP